MTKINLRTGYDNRPRCKGCGDDLSTHSWQMLRLCLDTIDMTEKEKRKWIKENS